MDRKRKADGNESSDIVSPDMDISDNLDESMSSKMVLSKLVQSAGASACQNPAVTALLAMAAEDVCVASTISTLAILKRRSLEKKQLPGYPLGLDALRLKELRSLQIKRNKLGKEYGVSLREARMDYLQKMNPLYQRRNEIVAGVTERGVPDFWLSALLGNTYLDNEIAKKDEQALRYLMNIDLYKTDAPERMVKLEFVFDSSNPYFENTVLTKVIYFKIVEGADVVDRTEGTTINWKEGKCLNPMYNISGREQGYHLKSFFNFFRSSDELDLAEDRLATMKLHAHTA